MSVVHCATSGQVISVLYDFIFRSRDLVEHLRSTWIAAPDLRPLAVTNTIPTHHTAVLMSVSSEREGMHLCENGEERVRERGREADGKARIGKCNLTHPYAVTQLL